MNCCDDFDAGVLNKDIYFIQIKSENVKQPFDVIDISHGRANSFQFSMQFVEKKGK